MLSSCRGSLECSLRPLSIFLSSGYTADYINELLAWTDTLFSVSVFVQLFGGGVDFLIKLRTACLGSGAAYNGLGPPSSVNNQYNLLQISPQASLNGRPVPQLTVGCVKADEDTILRRYQ